jgi:hypothetical protein
MLKKLLDEFSEKEAHTREEINVITEQIGELEKRILTSQQKLNTVAVDREKVRAMQARYSGGSTLTPGTPLLGAKPSAASESSSEESREKEPRPRPGRAASSASTSITQDVGIPVAPLNVRASSTRIPAMAPPEPSPVAETASSFLSAPAHPTAPVAPVEVPIAQPKAFSPMDLFGSPADEPVSPIAQPEAANLTPDYATGASYNAGVSYDYQNAQPIEPLPTATPAPALEPAPASTPTSPTSPSPAAAPSGTSSIGEITTSFFTPMGSTEAALQPSSPFAQPSAADAATQHSLFLDPNQQPQAAQPDDAAQVQDLDEDEPDDTVKSINDALRGLFR